MKKFTTAFLAVFMVLGLALAGCGNSGSNDGSNENSGSDSDSSSSESVGEQVDYTVTGIDPGAGVMKSTKQAFKDYGLDKWKLQSSSGSAMTAALDKAIKNKEPIVITGWKPHWMFSKYDLKMLKDPKKSYGEAEDVHTIVNKDLESNYPQAYKLLKQFQWTKDDMGKVMVDVQEGSTPEEAAQKWVDNNQDKVKEWTKGVEEVDGKKFTFSYVSWVSAVASHNVIKVVMEDLGFDVTLKQLNAGSMWSAISKGGDNGAQATLSGWLPITHKSYWKQYKGDVEDLATNLEGTPLGLTVPAYMDVDSIEDLKSE